MFVEEITIDGFKSYAKRTVVPALDPQFNAITGLNGSGKSNILDSICFVLGITNLSQVRAENLQALVYKQGQAGVTKASVSIVFNNADKANSPVGYEEHDQITVTRQIQIGGKNKFLINGRNALPKRVQDMFKSVQLNVDNPHFLIMQGRITKVLNAKPMQTLSMLEEAAGTRMYENKKEDARRTIAKKQVKVEEINKVLAEDIEPALDKLRHEKAAYSDFQARRMRLEEDREQLKKHSFWESNQNLQASEGKRDKLAAEVDEVSERKTTAQHQADAAAASLQELRAEREQRSGDEVRRLQDDVARTAKLMVTHNAAWEHQREALKSEQAALVALQEQLEQLGTSDFQQALQAAEAAKEDAHAAHEKAKQEVEAAQNELAGAEAGDGRDGSNRSLTERLDDAKRQQTEANAELKAVRVRETHAKKELKVLEKATHTKDAESAKLEKDIQKAQTAAAEQQKLQQRLQGDAEGMRAAEQDAVAAAAAASACRADVDSLAGGLGGMHFQYDRRCVPEGAVHGVAGRLINGAAPLGGADTATALEVAAGGKLYNVVVADADSGKKLLTQGRLHNRVTLIPLDKVHQNQIQRREEATLQQLKQKVQQAVGNRAKPALELAQFDQSISPAMRHVFGNTFVCKDQATAKELAVDRRLVRCVSLEGDDFSPSGTLTGGSRAKGGDTLARVFQVQAAEAALAAAERRLAEAQAAVAALKPAADKHAKASKELELKEHELELLLARKEQSQASQAENARDAAAAAVDAAGVDAAAAQSLIEQLGNEIEELQQQIANFKTAQGDLLKGAKARLKTAKAALETARKAERAADAGVLTAAGEAQAAQEQRKELESQIAAASTAEAGLVTAVKELETTADDATGAAEAAKTALEELRAREADGDAEMKALADARSRAQDTVAESTTLERRLSSELKAVEQKLAEYKKNLADLQKGHQWNEAEMARWDEPGYFVFKDRSGAVLGTAEAYNAFHREEAAIKDLGKRVNNKVAAMFTQAEKDHIDLMSKKRAVENDKTKLEETIKLLDEEKKKALKLTWKKVDQDFGSIFSTLLPGTDARLKPPAGVTDDDFLDHGLEVRIAFNGLWQDSLSALSGGQRSLVALSLVLAMLLFKPAPIYVLDEVDAALDLSHTQNIGRMIKSHFPQSQFIVVSLKEGMFQNANVLFRTKFVDGVSTVTRTIGAGAGRSPAEMAAAASGKGGPRRVDRPPLRENVAHA